jgi:hypothetical protein
MVSHRMSEDNLLSRAPPCLRHVKPLVLAAFAVVSTHSSWSVDVDVVDGGLTSGRRQVVKIIAESISQQDEKNVVPTPLSGIRVGRR